MSGIAMLLSALGALLLAAVCGFYMLDSRFPIIGDRLLPRHDRVRFTIRTIGQCAFLAATFWTVLFAVK